MKLLFNTKTQARRAFMTSSILAGLSMIACAPLLVMQAFAGINHDCFEVIAILLTLFFVFVSALCKTQIREFMLRDAYGRSPCMYFQQDRQIYAVMCKPGAYFE